MRSTTATKVLFAAAAVAVAACAALRSCDGAELFSSWSWSWSFFFFFFFAVSVAVAVAVAVAVLGSNPVHNDAGTAYASATETEPPAAKLEVLVLPVLDNLEEEISRIEDEQGEPFLSNSSLPAPRLLFHPSLLVSPHPSAPLRSPLPNTCQQANAASW